MLTTQQIADEFGVAYQTVMAWIYKGLFPNAQREETPRGSYYLIPRSDLRNFKPQKKGRPKKAQPGSTRAAESQDRVDRSSKSKKGGTSE